ncbi:MAG: hypothetical protein NTZ75_04930 [Euryarchaeota archaeon]|nr:hypothetical protein [Euryarchaeota archaeon]
MQTKKQKNNLRKQGFFIYDLEDWKYNRETPTQNLKKMRMNFDEKKKKRLHVVLPTLGLIPIRIRHFFNLQEVSIL